MPLRGRHWRLAARQLFRRAWYIPLGFFLALLALFWSQNPETSLLKKVELYPQSPGLVDYELQLSADPTEHLQKIEFTYRLRPYQMLEIRFNEKDDEFDFVRLSGIEAFPSGIGSFRRGMITPRAVCEAFKGENEFTIGFQHGVSVTAGEEGCGTDWKLVGSRVRFTLHEGHPVSRKLPLDDLRITVVDSGGAERTINNSRLVLAAVWPAAKFAFAFLVLLFFVLGLFCPSRWLENHPHMVVGFYALIALLAVGIGFSLGVRGAKMAGIDLGGDEWYHRYMRGGVIDENLLAQAEVIENGSCKYSVSKSKPNRVIVLGGSSTFGSPYYPCREMLWTTRLQEVFDPDVEVMNLAAVSETFDYHLRRVFELALRRLEPDVVIVNCVANNWFYRRRFFNLLDFISLHRARADDISTREIAAYRRHLEEMIRQAREADVKLIFVEEPILIDYFHGANPLALYQKALAKVCAANGVKLVKAQNTFTERRDHFLFYDLVHL
ncbi:MAG: SGNH/GDSL hydrolase family protein, partial [Alphaproteobacteria bacterium]